MMWSLSSELLAFVVYFLYCSFFEWAFHKHLFHSPRFIKRTFKAHALVHHQRYKYEPNSYEWQQGQEKDHIAMDWFALPLFLGFHLPFFWLIEHFTGWKSMWGGVGSVIAYYTVYEYFHFCMHVPGQRWFETLRPFKFAKEHHRIHHKYMLQNLNVFFPLADVCLRTYRSAASVPQKASAPTAATPQPAVDREVKVTRSVKPLRRERAVETAGKK
jgi:hypothetical protein